MQSRTEEDRRNEFLKDPDKAEQSWKNGICPNCTHSTLGHAMGWRGWTVNAKCNYCFSC